MQDVRFTRQTPYSVVRLFGKEEGTLNEFGVFAMRGFLVVIDKDVELFLDLLLLLLCERYFLHIFRPKSLKSAQSYCFFCIYARGACIFLYFSTFFYKKREKVHENLQEWSYCCTFAC